jgi:hypothetical protein
VGAEDIKDVGVGGMAGAVVSITQTMKKETGELNLQGGVM